MEIVAHRGCAGQYPENTILAAERSAGRANWIEVDLRRCADGVVVFHDETLDRLTGAAGRLDETTLSALREYRVLGTDQRVPTFEELLEAVRPEVGVIADVKEPGIVADALRMAAETANEVRVLTGSDAVRRDALDADASTSVGYLAPSADTVELASIADRGYDFVYSDFEHCATTDFVSRAHDAGLAVNAGTIRTREEARHVPTLRERAVELLSVDRLDLPGLG